MKTVRVATRGSLLALTQTEQTMAALRQLNSGAVFETVIIRTTGDERREVPFESVGTKGMFVKEIEEALLNGTADLAVHSLKDLPGEMPEGLTLAAMPLREDPRDALVSDGRTLSELPIGAIIGTSSNRRRVLIQSIRPDLQVEELRGNLDTRLKKLDAGNYDAILLACAGVERMGWSDRIVQRLDPSLFVPAPGQGALAIEARSGDDEMLKLVFSLDHAETRVAATAERAFQRALASGCSIPAGALGVVHNDKLTLYSMLSDANGFIHRTITSGLLTDAERIGAAAAADLLWRIEDDETLP